MIEDQKKKIIIGSSFIQQIKNRVVQLSMGLWRFSFIITFLIEISIFFNIISNY